MWLFHFVNCHFSIIATYSQCFFFNFLIFFFFNVVIYLASVHVHPFFYFSQHLSLGISSRHSVAAVWGFPKHFSVQNNMEVMKSDGETMRSLWAYWYVCGGVRSGHALERVGRVVEGRRGRGL